MRKFPTVIFENAVRQGLFTAAEVSVFRRGKEAFSWRRFKEPRQVFFDLASLTKPLCTALLAVTAHERGFLDLNDPVARHLKTKTLGRSTLRDLLDHVSPLSDWHDFARGVKNPRAFAANKEEILVRILNDRKLLRSRAGGSPGRKRAPLYSDLGYVVLGAVLEKVLGEGLAALFAKKIANPLGLSKELFFVPLAKKPPFAKTRFVPTETCAWRGSAVQGEVMDENAWVMGGVSGHAGLFGTAASVSGVLSEMRAARAGRSDFLKKETFENFFTPDAKRPIGKRVFTAGFDTPTKPGSQSGHFFSKNSIGHLGYSGTSFWWDLQRDVWIVILADRCVFGRTNPGFAKWRPKAHDALMEVLKK